MELIYKILLGTHITAGSISLIVFWIPAFTKKGKKAHIASGKLYVAAMWIVVGSALGLSILNIINASYITAAFLGFLAVLTAHPLWYAIAILRYKRTIPDHVLNVRRTLNTVLALGGSGLVIWSILLRLQGSTLLLFLFGLLGMTSAAAAFESNEKARANSNWLGEHIRGMIITGIAAYTAFFAFGGRALFSNFLSDSLQVIPWILPTIIGAASMRIVTKKWKVA